MGIATEEQMKRMNEAIARDANRPLVERLRDPKNHYPAALRQEAANRIEQLETEARFLLARLNELEFSDLDDVHRDFCGHVEPSMSRLGDLLDNK